MESESWSLSLSFFRWLKSSGDSKALTSFFFFFLYEKDRSFIPKPGKMRQITQPYKQDIIIMDALSLLLNVFIIFFLLLLFFFLVKFLNFLVKFFVQNQKSKEFLCNKTQVSPFAFIDTFWYMILMRSTNLSLIMKGPI